MNTTYSAKKHELSKEWFVIDASGQTLGKLAVQVANILRGKHKPTYTPHVDAGDFVVVINAEKIAVSGKKRDQKQYIHHTGYPGGFRSVAFKDLQAKHPDRIIFKAVKGMLPHNRLGRQLVKKLKVYAGAAHPHEAQQPKVFSQASK
ncbi:50S ribosomal protein L13 [bacterium (Candidatus Blackallbacteria) CG17_big_fil_post_rev_8_21_14_2_50_48_46]|uniref:Large ribosomal subunit protein uL13 n=1 Tax=bacterium (Candidatus Blackallbacteria) CG17_big_fil_post_rev_8_21_14_2_50_48_46 TaxID=2014261 RepID=A0A2M7FX62_9BACT|nr:MAG: 50S ribosomal protein L13 [bacterium (Candidatus Blackallbacteria) CG18_big_fil_WC_8_21_14_2_50_49_26]PIW13848.1 MAG: 50S ribosomal protein L13 [bacterium (Candidatus Blackallbacteria) CG17_big_fil_post_rev_8_21_14_2_50_48_46]PIW45074.1 MAG: 50S ribosomal protein L13 [bacterium (Candidatus Blackallbacteria) CG13_big_fil_rev_8_21_14_2_50_49_14]